MGINVYLHYYVPPDRLRAEENDAVFREWAGMKNIDKLIVIRKPGITPPEKPHVEIELAQQPTLKDYRDAVKRFSQDDDISIVPNADCFIAEEDLPKLLVIPQSVVYCLLRVEVKSVRPPRRYLWRNRFIRRKHSGDSQDCWIFRGTLSPEMWLEFPLGKPGSDSRLAYEFQKAGFRILNPASSIRLYHYHRSKKRNYSEADRVPPPYAFPELK
jgi:hypothetical protein